MHSKFQVPCAITVLLALLATALPALTQNSRDPLLDTLATALEKGRVDQVDALAPKGFQEAREAYEDALKDTERGRNPERIRKQLEAGMSAMTAAIQAADTAREALSTVVATRNDALRAGAPKFAPEQWQKAATRFYDAALAMERNDVAGAQRKGAEAEVLLREAELDAIKGNILNDSRTLIAQAEAAKVERLAPRSLQAAKRYLLQAEQEITRNRYETTEPSRLAAQSSYEARHAMHLARQIAGTLEQEKDDKSGLEALILSWEEPLRSVATELNVAPQFDTGVQPVMQQLQAEAQRRSEQLSRLKQELDERNEQIAALNAEMQRLEARLGGMSEERIALQRRVDAQERLRSNVARIESSFAPGEARVYRQGDDVVISLTGLGFASGRSSIDAGSAALLSKVEPAVRLFPDAHIVVEGHTDSNGSDSTNLILSQDRADAVKQYIVTNFGVNPEKISSIGYGETRPAASNDTADGRARNRRIDLILHAGQLR